MALFTLQSLTVMSLQNDFFSILNTTIKDCNYYRQSFNRQKRTNTIEGAFGYKTIDTIYNILKGLLKPTRKTFKSINKRLQYCFDSLTALAVQFDRLYKEKWANYFRSIANQLFKLLPTQVVQLVLFDDSFYTNKAIIEKPVFPCFQQWLNRFNDRKFKRDLKRYLADTNFSYRKHSVLQFVQLSIPNLFYKKNAKQ